MTSYLFPVKRDTYSWREIFSTSEVSFDLWFYTVTIDSRSNFYPPLFTVVYYISIRSVKRQASKAGKSVFFFIYLAVN